MANTFAPNHLSPSPHQFDLRSDFWVKVKISDLGRFPGLPDARGLAFFTLDPVYAHLPNCPLAHSVNLVRSHIYILGTLSRRKDALARGMAEHSGHGGRASRAHATHIAHTYIQA